MSLSKNRKEPAVSIIMPVYNTPEEYLRPAIDSIRNQTLTGWELICVDDGSGEETAVVLRQYAAEDSRIRCIQTGHAGAGFARNAGLAQAEGTAVIFLDSDDMFLPELLEKSYQNLMAASADITIFRYQKLEEYQQNPNSARYGVWPAKSMPPVFFTKDCADSVLALTDSTVWNKLIRRDFLQQTGTLFTNLVVTQDTCFFYTLLCRSRRISYMTDSFLLYRTGNTQSLMHTFDHIPEETCQAFSIIKQNLERDGLWKLFRLSFSRRFLDIAQYYCRQMNEKNVYEYTELLKNTYFPALEIDDSIKGRLSGRNRAFYFFAADRKPWFGKKWGWPDKREIYFFKMKIFQYTRKKR